MASEVEKKLDLSIVRYSRVDEDCRVLSKALNIKPDVDVLLSITSSGDNVLNLLLERPRKIVALDFSPAQSSLLELKIAAISHLQYQDFMEILGEVKSSADKRMMLYQKIEEFLPEYSQKYWRENTTLLKEGLKDCGRLQKYFDYLVVSRIKEVVPPQALERFLSANDIEEQKLLFKTLPLNEIRNIIKNMLATQEAGRSQAQMKYTTLDIDDMTDLMWKHFCTVCQELSVADNFYLCLFMTGRRSMLELIPDSSLPPYLTKDGFHQLKGLVGRIELYQGAIEDYICNSSTSINKMNLSDIFEYMSDENSASLMIMLSTKMPPGGRIAFWNLYNDRLPPKDNPNILFLEDLSQKLYKEDRVFFYKAFCVIQIV